MGRDAKRSCTIEEEIEFQYIWPVVSESEARVQGSQSRTPMSGSMQDLSTAQGTRALCISSEKNISKSVAPASYLNSLICSWSSRSSLHKQRNILAKLMRELSPRRHRDRKTFTMTVPFRGEASLGCTVTATRMPGCSLWKTRVRALSTQ
jgi:hypothetical protein